MNDMNWISSQAHQIHGTFLSLFYVVITLLLSLGVFIEYFKWPLGGVPSFATLVGRTLIAALLLSSYSDVANAIADVSDGLSSKLGDLNQFKLVLSSMGDHLKTLSFSWVSVRELPTTVISFLGFFLLYFSVHVVEAFLLYAWAVLYVFSPIMIALFVLPATSSATKALYRTLFEMGCWKIVWSVLATLLWSTALGDIHKPGYEVNFLTSVFYNLILAGSVLLTPIVVHSLMSSGLSGMASTVGAISVGAATMSPGKVASSFKSGMNTVRKGAGSVGEMFKGRSTASAKFHSKGSNSKKSKPIDLEVEKIPKKDVGRGKHSNSLLPASKKQPKQPILLPAPPKKRP